MLIGSCITNEILNSYPTTIAWMVDWSSGSIWVCSWASEPKYLIYFSLPTSDKYNLDKIISKWVWRSLQRVQNGLGSLGKSIWFKWTLEAHDSEKSTRTWQQCKWISSLFISSGI